ncbi:uncharacterized protein METZ01_LOCUS255893 [marine metagenome]|uniref:Uncharacterized protein n=1 Tax=marine metagenome TaxID=408172 RepID=A0A382IUR5_9ZZZZ
MLWDYLFAPGNGGMGGNPLGASPGLGNDFRFEVEPHPTTATTINNTRSCFMPETYPPPPNPRKDCLKTGKLASGL